MLDGITKCCKTCDQTKPLADFPSHPKTRDRHRGECKACYRARTRRLTREWSERHPERRKRRRETPEQARAYQAFGYAMRSGQLVRPECCEVCGATGRIEGHHEDYSRPLGVQWLCKACHWQADRNRTSVEFG
jgi:hypothetical protein